MNSVVDHVQSARNKCNNTENLADEYAAYIRITLGTRRWEKEKRELGEEVWHKTNWMSCMRSQVKPRMHAVFTPIVYAFCDRSIVKKENFKVISVTLPSMKSGGEAFFGIEAQMTYQASAFRL